MSVCYPHPKGTEKLYISGGVPGGLHQTAGLDHNWALDFMAPGGTRVLAPENSRVTRLSGHNPSEGVIDGSVYGWNIYLTTASGIVYFITHLGNRDVKVGQKVLQGDILGHVGNWPHDEARSHSHIGVAHPVGDDSAKKYICKVSLAPKIHGQWPD